MQAPRQVYQQPQPECRLSSSQSLVGAYSMLQAQEQRKVFDGEPVASRSEVLEKATKQSRVSRLTIEQEVGSAT